MKHWALSLFLFFFFWEVFSLFPSKNTALEQVKTSSPFALPGLINVHSELSDGTESIPQLAALAKELGHSFVVFADQDTTAGRKLGLEKNYKGLDAFIEIENTTPSGELLTFFSHTALSRASARELETAAYDHYLGNRKIPELFVSISHPSHVKKPWKQLEKFPDGLEVINFDSLFWRKLSSHPLDFLGISAIYPLNPFLAALRFVEPFQKDLFTWDNMNSLGSKHFGILSSQFNRKIPIPIEDRSWPTYREVFSTGSNVVFLKEAPHEDFETRKKQIYEAIRNSRIAMVFQMIFPFAENDHFLSCPQGQFRSGEVTQGSLANCEWVIRVPQHLPYASRARIFKNSELTKEVTLSQAETRVPLEGPGTYRTEIQVRPHSQFWILMRKWVPYVLYNPIGCR